MIVWIIVLFLAPTMSNTYELIAEDTAFDEARTQFSILGYIANRIQFFVLFIGALMMIALFGGLKRDVI